MINVSFARVCGLLLLGLLAGNLANAQVFSDPADWNESAVPPPPAYDMGKLLTFEVTRSSPLVYGVDPASFSISTKRRDRAIRGGGNDTCWRKERDL